MPSWDVLAPHVGPVLGQMAIFLVAVGIINHFILKPFSGSHAGREKRITDTRATTGAVTLSRRVSQTGRLSKSTWRMA